jgi:hypothetical protein
MGFFYLDPMCSVHLIQTAQTPGTPDLSIWTWGWEGHFLQKQTCDNADRDPVLNLEN